MGKADGFAALVLPGAGEAHYDAVSTHSFHAYTHSYHRLLRLLNYSTSRLTDR